MLTSSIFRPILLLACKTVAYFPTIDISYFESFFGYIKAIIAFVLYFLPLGTVSFIVTVSLTLWLWRILVIIFKTLWACVPLM